MSAATHHRHSQLNDATIQRLRAKLWDTGYKLSSKKVEEFLDYMASTAMTQSISDDTMDAPAHTDATEADTLQPSGPCDTAVPQSADAQVERLERDIQALEYAIMKYISTNTFPMAVKEPLVEMKTAAAAATAAVTPPRQPPKKTSFPKKSDPVAMFHKMQTIWGSNTKGGRKNKRTTGTSR